MPIRNITVTAGNYGGYSTVQDWIKFQYEPRLKQLSESIEAYKRKDKLTSTDKAYLQGDTQELTSLTKQYKMYTKDGTRLKS